MAGHYKESAGTWETRPVPRSGVGADNVKSGGGSEERAGVGSAHSRGVAGVMPGDLLLVGEGLEGADGWLQSRRDTPIIRRNELTVATKLRLIAERARANPAERFTSLAHLLNAEFLAQCFAELRRQAAPGVDGVTYQEYAQNLEENLRDLVERMKAGRYRPQPVRRVYIPKDEKSQRPLGIPALEDKIVQMGMTRILEAIFEGEFLEISYGFRPGRSGHQALDALDKTIMTRPVNFVIDADIEKFFDSVDHKKLMGCLEQRIADPNFLRLIGRFLRAGVMEEGQYQETERGTPQGGILSPVLSNIFLHYALDRWFEGRLKKQLRGYAELNRYADDFVICVQYKGDAERILAALEERFAQCGLRLSREKTRLIEFGRNAPQRAQERGEKPETFTYLGFTHFCDRTRRGKFKVGRRTSPKKFRAKLKALNRWLRGVRNQERLEQWWPKLAAKLAGHFRYYGVSGNYPALRRYYAAAVRLAFKWINRRSQKKSYNWEEFSRYLAHYPLPQPRIYHNLYTLSPVL